MFSFPLCKHLEMALPGDRVDVVLLYKKLSSSLQDLVVSFNTPISNGSEFWCCTSSPVFVAISLFNFRCYSACDVVPHSNLCFPVHKL